MDVEIARESKGGGGWKGESDNREREGREGSDEEGEVKQNRREGKD